MYQTALEPRVTSIRHPNMAPVDIYHNMQGSSRSPYGDPTVQWVTTGNPGFVLVLSGVYFVGILAGVANEAFTLLLSPRE